MGIRRLEVRRRGDFGLDGEDKGVVLNVTEGGKAGSGQARSGRGGKRRDKTQARMSGNSDATRQKQLLDMTRRHMIVRECHQWVADKHACALRHHGAGLVVWRVHLGLHRDAYLKATPLL